MLADSVTPVGMADAMLAVILAPVWLVVTAHVLPVDVTEVGAPPATAAEMVRVGVPATDTRLIASTWKVTVWVAVCAWPEAAAATTRRPVMMMLRDIALYPPKRCAATSERREADIDGPC